MHLDAQGEGTDQADDQVGVPHGAMPFGIVMLRHGQIPLDADRDEQGRREIDEVVGEEHVQFTGEIAVQTHVAIGIEADQVEVQDAEEDIP